MDDKGLVYLEYSGNRKGFAVYADGKKYTARDVDAVARLPVIADTALITRHADGSALADIASRLVAAGICVRSYVESDMGDVSEVIGTVTSTLTTWVSGSTIAHPAGRVARFAPGADPDALASLIGFIFDPRWYSPIFDRPERNSSLEARLGLTPQWDRRCSHNRVRVTAAWMSVDSSSDADFFTRRYYEKTISGVEPGVAERRVGKYFVKCLLAAWLDADRPRGSEPLFDISHMFDARSIEASKSRI